MKRKFSTIALLVLLSINTICAQYSDADRVALVIGIQSYANSPLRNPLNDARDMTAILKAKGFEVVELYDPKTKRELQNAVRRYLNLLIGKKNATGMVYYSGHGVQVDGSNYLIPIDAELEIKADLEDQCLNMDYVMRAMEEAGNALNIFILDACRNNPFRSFGRSTDKGLSMVSAPKGSYIVYATKPGSVASDGEEGNGLFTSKLLKYINEEGLNIEQVFKKVAADVAVESSNAQRPWIAMDYTGDFYFTPKEPVQQVIAIATNTEVLPKVTEKKDQPKEDKTDISRQEVIGNSPPLDYGYGTSNAPLTTIGQQTWMAKNLNGSTFANGDPIPEAKTAKEWQNAAKNGWPAWCYYNNDHENRNTYGKLYNWYAVNDSRGLAPKGWHIPSDAEWTEMTNLVGKDVVNSLKSGYGWKYNHKVNNRTKFSGFPGAFRNNKGSFTIHFLNESYNSFYIGLGDIACWWSSSEDNSGKVWYREIADNPIMQSQFAKFIGNIKESNPSIVNRGLAEKGWGFSVRCVKDE